MCLPKIHYANTMALPKRVWRFTRNALYLTLEHESPY
uniref:Uncharacterized protein n=1 Tax=Arundo donax TaxID=35708 RepID=A0A0A8YDL7_ARUDO